MNAFVIDYGGICGGQVEWEKGIKIGQDRTGQDKIVLDRTDKTGQDRPK